MAAPSGAGRDDDKTVTGSLRWVKLRAMQVFWPACEYSSYSEAVAHTHDMWALRSSKPVLDAEDRILYFFGVGPRACHVVATGSAPNVQLCVAHEDDLVLAPWRSTEEFVTLCHEHQIPEDIITRAENNACFLRACEEAATYSRDVKTDEQASKLFISLLTGAKRVKQTNKSAAAREIINEKSNDAASSPIDKTPQVKAHKKAEKEDKPLVSELLKAPSMATMVAKCWQQMLEGGWETMTQANGQVLYKMPGTNFFEFRPNVNIFESLEKACARYLGDWVRSAAELSNDNEEQRVLTEFVWPMALASGWEALTSSSETLYKKKDTTFDQWVPNVTIFRSKAQAVAKYLDESGLASPEADAVPEEELAVSDSAASEDEDEEPEQPNGSEEDEEVSQRQIEEPAEVSDEQGDNGEETNQSEEERVAVASAKKQSKPSASRKRTATVPKVVQKLQSKATTGAAKSPVVHRKMPQKKPSKSSPVVITIPAFRLTFGKIEMELKSRGWYWKARCSEWLYYQPYCQTKAKEALVLDEDYFCGQTQLEMYLKRSGLEDIIREKLEQEYREEYSAGSEHEEEEAGTTASAPAVATIQSTTPALPKESGRSSSKSVSRYGRARSKSAGRYGRARSKSVGRSTRGLSSKTTISDVKFGEIWQLLSEAGWHFLPSSLEYDYFKPHCATAKDGKPGVDYFQNKDILIEHLKSSGLWDKMAARVRAEAALDSSSSDEDEMEDIESATSNPANKRKRGEITPSLSGDKRHKSGPVFHTPTDDKPSATADLTEDDEAGISPDASGVKGKELSHENPRGGPLSRNLANSFTPSPGFPRKEKAGQNVGAASKDVDMKPTKEVGPRELITGAIQRLTSGYTPTNFQHREKEFNQIREFFRDCFREETKTSLYISGAPGCGKTALLKSTQSRINELYRECCNEEDAKEPVRSHVNAMALADSSTLFCQLAETLTNKAFSNGDAAFEAIERATNRKLKSSRMMILVLDEIDILLKNNGIEGDLCRLFELAHRASHSFILVGIANQVDFTERHLPMLQQRLPECRPRVVIFEPYKHQTIEQILMDRLGGSAVAQKMVSTHGVSFLARKIASTTGDIRLAVDTCRRILQQKLDRSDKENVENCDDDLELSRPLPLTDMLRIIKHALESKSALIIRALPRNLQMILFASTRLLIVTANRVAASGDGAVPLFSVNELYTCYCDVSKDAGVFQPLAEREFRNSLETLSSEGLVAPAELKRQLVKLLFSTSELLQSFRKDAFFSRLV